MFAYNDMSLQGIDYALSANSLVKRAGEMMQWLRLSTRSFRGPMFDSQHSQRGSQPPINYSPRSDALYSLPQGPHVVPKQNIHRHNSFI